ncbi:MAG: glycosyltransferase, partial [Sediminibacterium sp.]|nr:glycosyltransferase [Sediminibacterium sp.]
MQGIQIHLHCFTYGRSEQPELNKYCVSVKYYERHTGHKGVSNTLPYIVSSRKNEKLLQDLLKDDHPILMEGIHSTCLLLDKRFSDRRCFVRLHNAEFQYYRDLCGSTSSLIKKMYYWMESKLLKVYEKKIANKAMFFGITEKDTAVYRDELYCKNICELPLFIPDWHVQCPEGMGAFCLYHGDLSVDANEKAAIWLLEKIFSKLNVPFVIMGKNPSEKLYTLAQENGHTCLVANPSEKELQDMISKAHIHVLPSYTTTGIKIKLVNVLFNGRHCVVNDATVAGNGLASACHIGTTANAFREIIAQLYHQPFTQDEIALRKQLLEGYFNNE